MFYTMRACTQSSPPTSSDPNHTTVRLTPPSQLSTLHNQQSNRNWSAPSSSSTSKASSTTSTLNACVTSLSSLASLPLSAPGSDHSSLTDRSVSRSTPSSPIPAPYPMGSLKGCPSPLYSLPSTPHPCFYPPNRHSDATSTCMSMMVPLSLLDACVATLLFWPPRASST